MLFYFSEEDARKLIEILKNQQSNALKILHSNKSTLSEDIMAQTQNEVDFLSRAIDKLNEQL